MLDTQERGADISSDTTIGPYPRLTAAAVERAKSRLKISDLDALARTLGFSRQTFWRVRNGQYDVRLSEALRVSRQCGLPLHKTFEGSRHA